MEPFDPFIPRQIEDKELEKILNAFSWGLDKVVDFGSNLVKWDVETARGQDDNLPITLSLRHFIELIDGTSILIKKASVDPSKLLLRGALETYFGLEYIFEKDTKQRCMSFLVWHAHKKLKTYQRLDNSTQQGKQLEQAIKKDDLLSDFSLPTIPKLAAAIDNLESLLKLPLYQQAEVEYQRLVGQGEKNPAWYRLFNGSNSIDELARRLWRQQKVCTIAGLGVLITFGFHYLHLPRGHVTTGQPCPGTVHNKMFLQWRGSVSSLSLGFIIYIWHVGQGEGTTAETQTLAVMPPDNFSQPKKWTEMSKLWSEKTTD